MQKMSCAAVQCHLWLAVVAVLVAMTTHHHQADANSWAPIVPSGGMAQYECCCENPDCGDCFLCRNDVYVCYCDTCSCYAQRGIIGHRPSVIGQRQLDDTHHHDNYFAPRDQVHDHHHHHHHHHDNDGKSTLAPAA